MHNYSLRNVEEVDVASCGTFQKSKRLDCLLDRKLDNQWGEKSATFVTQSDVAVIANELAESYNKEWQEEKAERDRLDEIARVSEETREF